MAKKEMHPNSLRSHGYNSSKGGVVLAIGRISFIARSDLFQPEIRDFARKIHLDLLQLQTRLDCSRVVREEEL